MHAVHGQLVAVGQLYHPTEVHYHYSVGYVFNYREVMRNEQICKIHLILQVLEHVDNLGLNRYVKSRYRLIADYELRIYGKRSGNSYPLSLSTGEFVRISVSVLRVQSYPLKETDYLIISLLLARAEIMDVYWLTYDITYRHTRVQTRIRILEYYLHALSVWQHIYGNLLFFIEEHLAVVAGQCSLSGIDGSHEVVVDGLAHVIGKHGLGVGNLVGQHVEHGVLVLTDVVELEVVPDGPAVAQLVGGTLHADAHVLTLADDTVGRLLVLAGVAGDLEARGSSAWCRQRS